MDVRLTHSLPDPRRAAGTDEAPAGQGAWFFGVRCHLIAVLLLLLLPVAGLRVYDILAARDGSIAEAKRDALAAVRQGAVEQSNLIDRAATLLTLVAELSGDGDANAAACPTLLARIAAGTPWALRILVARLDGEVRCWSDGGNDSVNVADRSYFRDAVAQDKIAVSDFIVTRKDNRPALTLARGIRDAQGKVTAVAAVTIDLRWLTRLIDAGGAKPDALVVLTDRHGTVLARSQDADRWVGSSIASAPAVVQGLVREEGTLDGAFADGIVRIGAFTTIPGSNAKLFIGRPTTSVLPAIDAEIRRALLQLGILVLIAGALAWIAAEAFLLRWIRRLVAAAAQLGEGRFDARLSLPAIAGELKLVGDALDGAGARLASREADLTSAESLFRGLFDHLPERQVVYRIRDDGKPEVETWNAAAGSLPDVIHPLEDVMRSAATGAIVRSEDERIDASGARTLFEITCVPLADASSRIARVLRSSRDVTHFRAAETDAREANRMLRVAEGVAHVGHWRVAFPGEGVFWSDEIYRIHGLDKADYRPTLAGGIAAYHPEDRTLVERQLRQALDVKGYLDFTARIVRPDGDVRSVVLRGFLQEEANSRRSLFGVMMDVTELRRAESLLRDNAAMLKVTLESMDEGLVMSDPDGRVRVFNRRALDLLGLPTALMASQPQLSEVVAFQQRHGEFGSADDQVAIAAAVGSGAGSRLGPATQDGHAATREWTRPNGTILEVRQVALPTGGAVQTFTDMTARRGADAKTRAAEARYRLLAENMSDVVVRLDLAFEREYVSPACRTLLGYEPEELVGHSPYAMMHPDDVPAIAALVRDLIARGLGGEGLVATYRVRHRLGHWVWVEASMRLALDGASGQPATIVSSLRDVSERQARTLELKLAKEAAEIALAAAEHASHAKTDFLAAMSHEIRTPLNAVIGFGELLAESGALAPDLRRYADIVRSSGSALLTLVNDILDFSKIEAGAVELDKAAFTPSLLVENCLSITRGAATSKALQVFSRIDGSIPDLLVGDEGRLRQILLNLLNNAIKFTKHGSVSLALRHDGSGPTGERLRFSVTDTGIGIASDKQHRLFQRFSQVDASISRDFGGTGLGLAISKRLVELMGGEIGVFSEEGRGATFWFTVTLARGFAADAAAVVAPAPFRRRGRLLLVDDVEINRELARAVLVDLGHDVEMVADGAAAVRAVQDLSYDVVLMDVQMPGMDGMAATRLIRELPGAAARVPIVAMTANVLPQQIREFRTAGMDDHVGKPFRREELAATVDRYLPGQSAKASQDVPVAFDRNEYGFLVDLVGRETALQLTAKLRQDLVARFTGGAPDRERLRREAHATVAGAHMLGFRSLSSACTAVMQAEDDAFNDAIPLLRVARDHAICSIDELLKPKLAIVASN